MLTPEQRERLDHVVLDAVKSGAKSNHEIFMKARDAGALVSDYHMNRNDLEKSLRRLREKGLITFHKKGQYWSAGSVEICSTCHGTGYITKQTEDTQDQKETN